MIQAMNDPIPPATAAPQGIRRQAEPTPSPTPSIRQAMSVTMEDGIERWTAKRKSALVVEIFQGKTSV